MNSERTITDYSHLRQTIRVLTPDLTTVVREVILSSVTDSKEYKRLKEIAGTNGSHSPKALEKAIVDSMSVKFEPLNQSGRGQVRISFSSRKIKDILTNELDQFTYSKIRRRNDSKNCELEFVGDLIDMKSDSSVILSVDWTKCAINARMYDPDNWTGGQVSFLQDIVFDSLILMAEAFKDTVEDYYEKFF